MSAGSEARVLLLQNCQGVLSTNSVEMPGYPFGSVVPYCLDETGNPVILISRIAQHTKNILADPKVSLITIEQDVDDIQTGGRLTWVSDVKVLQKNEAERVVERYYRYFPQARDYHKTHDFDFYRLELVRARYIGGFGKIHWITPENILLSNTFSAEQERGMIDHMNHDHVEAMQKYCSVRGIETRSDDPEMVGIDEQGFHLRVGEKIIRFSFSETAKTTKEVRTRLVAMARL